MSYVHQAEIVDMLKGSSWFLVLSPLIRDSL